MTKLTIIIPVYNESETVSILLHNLIKTVLPVDSEIIVVNDGSTDDTLTKLQPFVGEHKVKIINLAVNQGKSNAIRVGIDQSVGDYVLIQDADLEYSPSEIPVMLSAVSESSPVVFGSINLVKNPHSSEVFFWGGIFLTKLANILYSQSLTDVATCYKLFPKSLIKTTLSSKNFAVCYELTALISKSGVAIIEVPISYTPRSKAEGKKITAWDGLEAAMTLIKFKFKK